MLGLVKVLVPLTVNGETQEVAVPPHWTLLEALRYELGLTGSKQGCDKGDCGACTVLVDGEAKLSCIMLAVAARGHEICTIEGLARPTGLDPVQEAFDECGALQCGFCQSGVMISARALLDRDPHPTDDAIKRALSGNLCRCTGYTKIFEAVRRAEELESEPASEDRIDVPRRAGA
jgi:aerobic-type carbon monoxide dehydrogenase small subunit (CoxS/CutS family)